MINFFVYGVSGSGKDTIANYLRDNFGYSKLRIARTIKQLICERENLSFDELENLKRTDERLRKLHNTIGNELDVYNSTKNRIEQLINGKSMDYEYVDFNKPKVICDVRSIDEAKAFLVAGYYGIFLTRTTSEKVDLQHWTEKSIFNKNFVDLLEVFNRERIYIIENSGDTIETLNSGIKPNCFTDGTTEQLLKIINNIINKITNK